MRQIENQRRNRVVPIGALLFVVLVTGSVVWCHSIYSQIQSYATRDEAAPADAICVFGAAEYDGRPSPVFRARLDHALELYRRGIAPFVISLGGNGGDQYNEGSVGRDYLISKGVPEQAIIAETVSRNTEESARRIAVIANANHFGRLVIVSDGTHLFRIHAICTAEGLNVLTSPRARPAVEDPKLNLQRLIHEILSYTAWRLHLH